MRLHHRAEGLELWQGDATGAGAVLEAKSVQCIVTSPPYWGLRDYGMPGQLGQEADVRDYVANVVVLVGELRKLLADDGVLWLNLGDTYSGRANAGPAYTGNHQAMGKAGNVPPRKSTTAAAPYKSLVGVPWRVALALIDDGWLVRSEVIWAKPNPMPESVRDRPTRAHEQIFMLTKRGRYYYDAGAIAEPIAESSVRRLAGNLDAQAGSTRGQNGGKTVKALAPRFGGSKYGDDETGAARLASGDEYDGLSGMRNKRDVWTVGGSGFKGAHFATFPPELVRPCVLSSSRPGDLVLDPFNGSGTTGMVALQEGRRYIGIDLNAEYLDLSIEHRFSDRPQTAGTSADGLRAAN